MPLILCIHCCILLLPFLVLFSPQEPTYFVPRYDQKELSHRIDEFAKLVYRSRNMRSWIRPVLWCLFLTRGAGRVAQVKVRDEELAKLRKKVSTTVHILTHQKEKLQHVHRDTEVPPTAPVCLVSLPSSFSSSIKGCCRL